MLHDIDHIGHNCACRGQLAGSSPIEHGVPDGIAAYDDGIEYVFDTGKGMFPADDCGRYARKDPVPLSPADRYQFYHRIHRFSIQHIRKRYPRYALGVDPAAVHVLIERNGREDRDLPACVMPFDVGSRVRFCIAVLLRIFQGFLEAAVFPAHLREYIVGGTVQYSRDAVYDIGGKALAQGPDYRYASADARLEQVAHTVVGRQLEQFRSVDGNKFLVRCNDMLACAERPYGEFPGSAGAAYGFHDDFYPGVAEYFPGVPGHEFTVRAVRKIPYIEYLPDPDLFPGPVRYAPAVFPYHFGHARADHSVSKYRYIHGISLLMSVPRKYLLFPDSFYLRDELHQFIQVHRHARGGNGYGNVRKAVYRHILVYRDDIRPCLGDLVYDP